MRFVQVLKFVASAPPWKYGIIYLAAMVGFALVYSMLPNQFFHSSVRYETSVDKEATDLLAGIRKALISPLTELNQESLVLPDGWRE